MEYYCYWNKAEYALAERQTPSLNEKLAAKLLRARGSYRYSEDTRESFPFPAPEPSMELVQKYPALADMPRDENALSKLKLHLHITYREILDKLHAAGEIEFFDPVTHLKINDVSQIQNPIVYMDRIAAQIVEYSNAYTAPVANKEAAKGITKSKVINAFDGLHFNRDKWSKYLGDPPDWLKECRVALGSKNASATWNPVLIAVALLDKGVPINKLNTVFVSLKDWTEEWQDKSAIFTN